MPRADWRGSLARSSNGLSVRKIAPALGALVKVAPEKPTTLTPCADAGHLQRDIERALLHGVGARQRGAGRQLHDDDEIAAVDLRDEADRRLPECVEAETDDDQIDHEHDGGAAHGAAGKPGNAAADLVETPIEGAEEAMDRHLPPAVAVRGIVRA